ncbi:hypothetical protein [Acidomonas methanolica]|uniref:hypothetical protein n=1 Tax=Acidomonas methanolica TaxID=437 RepID=UPI00211A2B9A|nr:hypothetical protein [Acidomonas methanolica]MCQ9155869.1 hypothetical protein [Acidomonas methanolica]
MASDLRNGLDPSVARLQQGAEGIFDAPTAARLRGFSRSLTREAGRTLGDLTADQPLLFIAMTLIAGIFLGRRLRG